VKASQIIVALAGHPVEHLPGCAGKARLSGARGSEGRMLRPIAAFPASAPQRIQADAASIVPGRPDLGLSLCRLTTDRGHRLQGRPTNRL